VPSLRVWHIFAHANFMRQGKNLHFEMCAQASPALPRNLFLSGVRTMSLMTGARHPHRQQRVSDSLYTFPRMLAYSLNHSSASTHQLSQRQTELYTTQTGQRGGRARARSAAKQSSSVVQRRTAAEPPRGAIGQANARKPVCMITS
jgi:hypothetical protein